MPTIGFEDFSGGLWIPGEADPDPGHEQPFTVPPNALRTADNLEYLPSGGVRGRRGHRVLETLPGPIVGLARFYPRIDAGLRVARYKVAGQVLIDTGDIPWNNTNGVLEPADDQYAFTGTIGANGKTYKLRLWPLTGLSPIPGNATVTSFRVRVLRRQPTVSQGQVETLQVQLESGGSDVGNNVADTGSPWLESDDDFEQVVYGAAGTPLAEWGFDVTAFHWNTSALSVALVAKAIGVGQGYAQVDLIEVSCTYTTPDPATDETIIAVSDGVNLTYHGRSTGSSAPISYTGGSLATPASRPRIINWPEKNKVFIVDGTNPMLEYDGTELRDVPTDEGDGTVVLVEPRRGPYMCLYKNQFLATEPDEIGFSVYVSDVNDPTRWRGVLQVSANDSRGGKLTGLEAVGNVVVIFKDTALFNLIASGAGLEFGAQLAEFSNMGCIAPHSIQITPDGILYLARDGLYLTDGQSSAPVEVSKPIRSLFAGRLIETTYTDAVGRYHPRTNSYFLCLAQDANETWRLQKVTIPTDEGDQTALAWSRIPFHVFNAGVSLEGDSDDGDLLLGGSDGSLEEWDYGTDDDGTPFTTLLRTTERLLAPTRQMGRVNQLRPLWRSSVPLEVELRYDQAATNAVALAALGANTVNPEYQEPRRYVKNRTAFGRFVSVQVASDEGPEFELHRFDVDVRLRGQVLWR